MKRTKIAITSFVAAAIMMSCGGAEETNTENKTEEAPTTEKQVVEEEIEEVVEEPTTLENLDVTHGQAGPFTLNAAFTGEGEYMGYTMEMVEETRDTEEGPYTLTSYHAKFNGETHIIIYPKYDNDALIGELQVVSPMYKTSEGIGVGSSIDDFYASFKDAKAFYTYISGAYWLESSVYPSLNFTINEDDHLGEVDFDGDLTERSKESFKEGALIERIRIY